MGQHRPADPRRQDAGGPSGPCRILWKEAKTAHQLHNKHLIMRDAYAARTMQEKGRPTEHCTVIADKYRDVAKEYEALAAMHKAMAEQLK